MWSVVMIAGAALTAAASVLLAYWISPAALAVVGLPALVVGFWMILWMVSRYRVGALVLLLLSLPLGRLTLPALDPVVSPVTVLAVVAVAVWLWRVLFDSERIEFSYMQVPLAIFLLCGVISIYGAPDLGMAIKILVIFVMAASVCLVASQTIRSPEEVQQLMWAAATTAGIIGLYTAVTWMLQSGEVEQGGYDRAEGIFGYPNALGGFLALAIPPIFALAASQNLWWRRLLGNLLVTAAMVGLALTYSRGAWIGTAVGVLLLLPIIKRGWLAVGLALTTAMFTTAGNVLVRAESVATPGHDTAYTSRVEIWETSLRLLAEHPLRGVGLGNFGTAYGNFMVPDLPLLADALGTPDEAHNLFLNLAVEVGLVGAGAFAWLLVVGFLRAWQVRRSADRRVKIWGAGLAAGLVALLIHTTVDVVVYQGFTAILLFTYLGMMDALIRLEGGHVGYEPTSRAISASIRDRPPGNTSSAAYTHQAQYPDVPVRYPNYRRPDT
jgi:putative inorganic carbon (HCO3(-)) transporter